MAAVRRGSDWESERLIGGAIEAAPIAFTVLSESGGYVAANRAASRFSGYSRAELLGMSTGELSADPARTRLAVEEAFRTGSGSGVRQLRRRDGSILPVEYRLAPAVLGGERLLVTAWWPVGTAAEPDEDEDADAGDTTEASLSRTRERVLGVAFQKAPIAVTVSDGDANYLALNDRACELTGYSRPELFELGAFGVVVSPERPGGSLTDLPGIRRGVAEIRCRDGSTRRVGFRAATTVIGNQPVRIGVWWEAGA